MHVVCLHLRTDLLLFVDSMSLVNGWAILVSSSLQNEFNLEQTKEMTLYDLKIGASSDFLPSKMEGFFLIVI